MKTRTPETRTIAGFEVTTTRLPAMRALKLTPKVLRIASPLLPLWDYAKRPDLNVGVLVPHIMQLCASLDDETIDMLCRELLCETTVIIPDETGRAVVCDLNTPQLVDIALGGLENSVAVLAEILIFAGEVNFKRSFFDLLDRRGLAKKAAPSSSPTT